MSVNTTLPCLVHREAAHYWSGMTRHMCHAQQKMWTICCSYLLLRSLWAVSKFWWHKKQHEIVTWGFSSPCNVRLFCKSNHLLRPLQQGYSALRTDSAPLHASASPTVHNLVQACIFLHDLPHGWGILLLPSGYCCIWQHELEVSRLWPDQIWSLLQLFLWNC